MKSSVRIHEKVPFLFVWVGCPCCKVEESSECIMYDYDDEMKYNGVPLGFRVSADIHL